MIFHESLQAPVYLLMVAPVLKAGILILAQQVPSAKIMTTRGFPGVTLLMNHLVRRRSCLDTRHSLVTRDGGRNAKQKVHKKSFYCIRQSLDIMSHIDLCNN